MPREVFKHLPTPEDTQALDVLEDVLQQAASTDFSDLSHSDEDTSSKVTDKSNVIPNPMLPNDPNVSFSLKSVLPEANNMNKQSPTITPEKVESSK